MKKILQICLESPLINSIKTLNFLGETFELHIMGADYDIDLAEKLIEEYDGHFDVIAISGLPEEVTIKNKTYQHQYLERLRSKIVESAFTDGLSLRNLYVPWYIKRLVELHPNFFTDKKVGFFCATVQKRYLSAFTEVGTDLFFADPYFIFKIPLLLHTEKALDSFLRLTLPLARRMPLCKDNKRIRINAYALKHLGISKFLDCDIYVSNGTQLEYIDLEILKGKTLITDSITIEKENELLNLGVKEIINCENFANQTEKFRFTIIEAMILALKPDRSPLTFADLRKLIDNKLLVPDIRLKTLATNTQSASVKHEPEEVNFGFIIHPLQFNDLFLHQKLKFLSPIKGLLRPLENLLPLTNGMLVGKIENIQSTTGKKVNGYIYALMQTPKVMLEQDPQKFYDSILHIINLSKKHNVKIMGLGAYTKIVGDAGVSIAKRSPIPITTGNSLSSASTLWAAAFAIEAMGFVPKVDKKWQGTAMVIGTTGSIGKVVGKFLAQQWTKVILVAPKIYKLADVAQEIKESFPDTIIEYSNSADEYLHEVDLIVTSTSNRGKSVIDMNKVKSGAVICDVSRPYDLTKEQVQSRPDVLYISSGEVELPGDDVTISCNIGLHGNVVYACLAETALLALEDRFECFSLSRNLHFDKIKEIDQLSRKHGLKLAAIMSHDTEVTRDDILACRAHALEKKLSNQSGHSFSDLTPNKLVTDVLPTVQ